MGKVSLARNLEEFEGCKGETYTEEIGDTKIVCEEAEYPPYSCKSIMESIEKEDVDNTEEVYVATRNCLTDAFKGDETVRHRLVEQESLGMNRNLLAHESPSLSSVPRQALVVTNHPSYDMMMPRDIEKEILTTVRHENAHLGGVIDESETEKQARM